MSPKGVAISGDCFGVLSFRSGFFAKTVMEELESKLSELREFLKIEYHKSEIERINVEVMKPDFWEDKERAKNLSAELAEHQEIVEKWEQIQNEYKDIRELEELGENVRKEIDTLKDKIERLELESIFTSSYDKGDAILTIHPGAGGTESCDWSLMLFRMYLRWCERKGFTSKVLDYEAGEVAGLKDATIEVKGKNAYGWLKGEAGIHRLVRISPFDAGHRRHTSFASCFVYPLMEGEIKIELKENDLKIETFRASGHGGQNVNKVSSAVRITHLPTGIVVKCQAERSQYQNKEIALQVLKSRLYHLKEQEEQAKLSKLLPKKYEIGWAREIRSYIFCPYTLVKDHRTGVEIHKVEEVMDGALDPFMRTWLLRGMRQNQNAQK